MAAAAGFGGATRAALGRATRGQAIEARHFFHGQRSNRMNILHYCSVLYCCFFFFLLTSLICSFLFLQIKEIKLNMLNTVNENQIYFVLSRTFEPFSFFLHPFLLPFFVDLCILPSQFFSFLRFKVFVCTSFLFKCVVLTKSLGVTFVGDRNRCIDTCIDFFFNFLQLAC